MSLTEKLRLVLVSTRKYKGILPLSPAITGAYEESLHNEIHAKLHDLGGEFAACQATYVLRLFCKTHIFNGTTLRLYASDVPAECPLVCVAIFTVDREASLVFECIHLISRVQWQKATLVDTHYKSFALKHLLTIQLNRAPPSPLSSSSSSDDVMSMQVERSTLTHSAINIEAEAAQEYTVFQPFWLATQLQRIMAFSIKTNALDDDEEDEEEESSINEEERRDERAPYLSYYVQLTIDVCLFQRCFAKHLALKKKLLLYYQAHIKQHHQDMMFLFIAQMIQRSSKQKTYQTQQHRKEVNLGETLVTQLECEWRREWLATELFLFHACQWHSVLRDSGERIKEHVALMRARIPEIFWPSWYAYEDDRGLYWYEDASTGTIKVKAEWLYQEEFSAILAVMPLKQGYTHLTQEAFTRLFMPCLYRLLLEDCLRYLFLVYHGAHDDYGVERYDLERLREFYCYSELECHEVLQALQKFKLTNAVGLYDCAAEIGNISSPVLRKWAKTQPAFDLSRGDGVGNGDDRRIAWRYRAVQRDAMPDIEDLVCTERTLPACMRQVMLRATPFKMGNNDRINLMRLLIELGYTCDEAVGFFAKRAAANHEHAKYVEDMTNTYNYFAKLHRTETALTGSQCHSFGCSSLINVRPDTKNSFTCPYAQRERLRDPSKTRFEWQEKMPLINECAATLSHALEQGEYLQHPVQYVLHQLSK